LIILCRRKAWSNPKNQSWRTPSSSAKRIWRNGRRGRSATDLGTNREIEMFMEGGIQNIPDDYIVGLLRSYLAKNFCQNRGYVLDDYPRITEQVDGLEKNEKPVFTYSFRLKNCLVKAKMREEKKKKQQKFRTEIKFYRISWSAWWQRMNSSPNES
jgi:adenylate kinase family enzyme